MKGLFWNCILGVFLLVLVSAVSLHMGQLAEETGAIPGPGDLLQEIRSFFSDRGDGAFLRKGDRRDGEKALVVLDAGHGGVDPGKVGIDGQLEKEINLEVVNKLAEELRDAGAAVLLTREDDTKVGLEDRAEYANENNAEFFVSIHCNFCEEDAGVKGLECYYRDGSSEGEALAERIIQAVESEEQISCRGTRIGDFRVLNKTKMPAVLVEIGYLSNQSECRKLTEESYQKQLAKKLAEGILSTVPPSS